MSRSILILCIGVALFLKPVAAQEEKFELVLIAQKLKDEQSDLTWRIARQKLNLSRVDRQEIRTFFGDENPDVVAYPIDEIEKLLTDTSSTSNWPDEALEKAGAYS